MREEPKKYVKKTSLSVFNVDIKAQDCHIISGKIVHQDSDEEHEFVDLYDMINYMHQKYDKFGYPQASNKLRTWKD